MKTIEFEIQGEDGSVVKYKVDSPSVKERQEGKRVYNQTFREAVKSGAWLRAQINELAKETGIWNESKEARLSEINAEMVRLEKKLEAGGYELEEAKKDALEMKALREESFSLSLEFATLLQHTAEGQAQSVENDYMVYLCLKDMNGKRYCSSFDDYMQKKDADDLIVASALIRYSYDVDFYDKLPEVKFMNKFMPETKVEVKEEIVVPQPFLVNGIAISE